MRYIGNKENIVDKIYNILERNGVVGDTLFDLFSGTASVAKYYKQRGYRIFSSDLLYMSYCLQRAYIANNSTPKFIELLAHIQPSSASRLFSEPLDLVLDYLSNIEPVKGFIYKNYTPDGSCDLAQPRMYFSAENGAKIDAIRQKIEEWNSGGLLAQEEYYILLTSLLESISFYANISGVYAAFQKKWDPRAVKSLRLRPIKIIDNSCENICYNCDSVSLAESIDVDILYLDPPYNNRQYLPNYHLVETIAKYDNPEIHGVTGMRDYENKRSRFCNAKTALDELDNIARKATYKYLVMSYNSEGIIPSAEIIRVLSKYGSVKLEEFEYQRFKSNSNGALKDKRHIFEQLYILTYEQKRE